jgi:hypothetical protein
MTLLVRGTWLFLAVVYAVVPAGCGSDSTGKVSGKAMRASAENFAGPDGKFSAEVLMVQYVGDEAIRPMTVVVACRPAGGGCELIAPDGAAYSDLREFVDDTELLDSGDSVHGNVNLAAPGEPERYETVTKRDDQPWGWYVASGGALLVLVALVIVAVRWSRRSTTTS